MKTTNSALILPALLAMGLSSVLLPAPAFAQEAAPQVQQSFKVQDLKIGNPVFGADGIKVGEVNRIKANSDGKVTEVQVTTGGPAGLDAEVVVIAPDQIATNDAQSVKLKISGTDAKSLPVLGKDDKG